MPAPAQTPGRMQQVIAHAGSCSHAWRATPKAASTWFSMPFSVGSNIIFHMSVTTSALVRCGRKYTVRKKTFPRGISLSSSASRIGVVNPSTSVVPTYWNVRPHAFQNPRSCATRMKLSSPSQLPAPTIR